MTYYGEWKKVLRIARSKGFEIMGTDDYDVFQELCKVAEDRFDNDPVTDVLVKAAEAYGNGKGFYVNHEIIGYDEIIEGLKYNNCIGDLYRQQAYPIITKVLQDNYDYILSELTKEIPMINKRSRNANALIAEYEKQHGNSKEAQQVLESSNSKKSNKSDDSDKTESNANSNDNSLDDNKFIDDIFKLEEENDFDLGELEEDDIVLLKATDFTYDDDDNNSK